MIGAFPVEAYPVIVVILGGGAVTAFVALRKSKPEIESIQVNMSQGVLVMQKTLMDDLYASLDRSHEDNEILRNANQALREDNDDLRRRMGALERQMRDLEYLTTKVQRLEDENRDLRAKNLKLEERVVELELQLNGDEGRHT